MKKEELLVSSRRFETRPFRSIPNSSPEGSRKELRICQKEGMT